MLQIIYSLMPKNRNALNNDTIAMKIVERGMGNVLIGCLFHSLYVTYFGRLIDCGGNGVEFSETFINSICWNIGVHVYANTTKLQSEFWSWEYEPDRSDFYPALPGKAEFTESMVYLTTVNKIPLFFMLGVALLYSGKVCWSFLLGNFLKDLAGPLDSSNKDKVAKAVLSEDEKDALFDEVVDIFVKHLRFYNDLVVYYICCLFATGLAISFLLYTIIDVVGGNPQFGFKVLSFIFLEYLKWPIDLLQSFRTRLYLLATLEPELPFLICSSFFLTFPCIARRDLKNTLKLHPKSKAFKATRHITPGGIFVLMLLSKNIQFNQVCVILEKTLEEVAINRTRFRNINKGIL